MLTPARPKDSELAFIRINHTPPIDDRPIRTLFGEAESRLEVPLLKERLPPLDSSHQTDAPEDAAHGSTGDGLSFTLPEELLGVDCSVALARGHQPSNPTLSTFRDSLRAARSSCVLAALGLLPALADVCHGRRADSLAASNLVGRVLFLQEDEDAGTFLGSKRRHFRVKSQDEEERG